MLISADRVWVTPRCSLRAPRLVDAPSVLDAITHPRFPKALPFAQLTTLEAIEGALHRRRDRWQAGSALDWCADERASGRLVAMVGVRREAAPKSWSLSFWVHPEQWGRGYATEIAEEALRIAVVELAAETLGAATATWNAASQRVLEKLGFTLQSENPDGYRIQGKAVPTKEYQMSSGQWRVRRSR